jgi:LacI family transcriptional regulator
MKRQVTLKDVAKAAGVHVSTASRALDPKNRHLITPEAAQRILDVSRELGYRHNAAAAALRTARSRMIGVLIPDIANPIFPPIIRGIEDSLGRNGYLAIIGNTDNDPSREEGLTSKLQERGVDGFILASVELRDGAVAHLAAEGVPIVTVNRRSDNPNISSVVHDEDEGIKRALTHLASLGHRRIANIAGPQRFSTGADRYAAFERHRATLRLAPDENLVTFARGYTESEGERCVEELLVGRQDFTAIVCANDRLAIGAIESLARRGIRCPQDVSITGYNDMPMVDRLKPPLTTVRIEQYKIGYDAGDLLARMIEGGISLASHIVLPVDLIIRESTMALAKIET